MAAKQKAAKISAPRKPVTWRGEVDFAKGFDDGAVGAFPMRGDGKIPEGAIAYAGYVDVEEAVSSDLSKHTQTAGSLAILLGGKVIFAAQRGHPSWTAGRKALAIGEGALVTVAEDAPQVVITEEPFGAGKFQLVLEYYAPSKAALEVIKDQKAQDAATAKRAELKRKAAAKEAAKAAAKAEK